MNGRILAAVLIALTAIVLLAPRTAPRGAPVIPSSTMPSGVGAAETAPALLGAPHATLVQLGAESESDADLGQFGGGAPHPSGGIGTAASYCRQFCGTPKPRSLPSRIVPIGNAISGTATWYRWHPGEAAAGPGLRAFLGPDWRGTLVTVFAPGCTCRPVAVVISDWCACKDDRVVDLDVRSFAALADPSRGIIPVLVMEGDWTR